MTARAMAISMAILATTISANAASAGETSAVLASVPTNAWIGHWRGPDGRTLSIAADGGAYSGHYHVMLKSGSKERHFTGLAYLETIVFDRDGRKERIRRVAGKTPCLAIGPRERYCRT